MGNSKQQYFSYEEIRFKRNFGNIKMKIVPYYMGK